MQSTVRAANPNNSVVVPMSALDQKQAYAAQKAMSALGQKRTQALQFYWRRRSDQPLVRCYRQNAYLCDV